MEVEISAANFEVELERKIVVRATNHSPSLHVLTLSNLDLLSGRFPVTYLYFYNHLPRNPNQNSITDSLKTSLAESLNYFYPMAGRIAENKQTGEPEIICDNTGALLVQASANIALSKLNFYNIDEYLQGKLVNLNLDFPAQVQVTQFRCGGICITFTFDHALGDASSFSMFLMSWAELAQHKSISCIPNHDRNCLRPRSPLSYEAWFDQAFMKCSIEEIINMDNYSNMMLVKRLYHIDASAINRLQNLASENGEKRTKIEAFSAYIWKMMVSSVDDKSHENCKMGWLVDGRGRLGGDKNSMVNYIGNLLSVAVAEASVKEVKESCLSAIARRVNREISKVSKEDHFLDLVDWIESKRPGMMMSKVVLGRGGGGGVGVVVSSGRRFPVSELEFGFGKPVMGTVCSTIERLGVGYVNQRESGRCDGSWTVSVILWPQLVAALESDSIFQPMSAATHLPL